MKKSTKVLISVIVICIFLGLICIGYYAYTGGFSKPSVIVSEEQAPENVGSLEYDFTVLSSSISQALSDFGVEVGIETIEGMVTCRNLETGEDYIITMYVDVVGENNSERIALSQDRIIKSEGKEFEMNYSAVLPNGLKLENLHFAVEKEK